MFILVSVPLAELLGNECFLFFWSHLSFAFDGPSLELDSFLLLILHLLEMTQIKKFNHIVDQVFLYLKVKRRVGREGR